MPRGRFRKRSNPMAKFTQSLKHQHSLKQSAMAAPKANFNIIQGIGPGAARLTGAEVQAGAHVFGVDLYLNFVNASASTAGDVDWYYIVLRTGQTLTDAPTPDFSSIGLSNMRNQILWSEALQIGTEDGQLIRRFKHVKIPKMYRRIREGDVHMIVYGIAEALNQSFATRFKSYS